MITWCPWNSTGGQLLFLRLKISIVRFMGSSQKSGLSWTGLLSGSKSSKLMSGSVRSHTSYTIAVRILFGLEWAYLMIKVHTKNLPQILGNDTQYASKLAFNCNWAVCHVWCPPMNLLLSANSPLLLSYLPAPQSFFVVVWWLPPGSQHRKYVEFFFHSVYEQELHGHWGEHLSLFPLLFSTIAVPVLNQGERGLLCCYHYPILCRSYPRM